MVYTEDLVLTRENGGQFVHLTEIKGCLTLEAGVKAELPLLKKTENIKIKGGGMLEAPILEKAGVIELLTRAKINAPSLGVAGGLYLKNKAIAHTPNLQNVGELHLSAESAMDTTALLEVKELSVSECNFKAERLIVLCELSSTYGNVDIPYVEQIKKVSSFWGRVSLPSLKKIHYLSMHGINQQHLEFNNLKEIKTLSFSGKGKVSMPLLTRAAWLGLGDGAELVAPKLRAVYENLKTDGGTTLNAPDLGFVGDFKGDGTVIGKSLTYIKRIFQFYGYCDLPHLRRLDRLCLMGGRFSASQLQQLGSVSLYENAVLNVESLPQIESLHLPDEVRVNAPALKKIKDLKVMPRATLQANQVEEVDGLTLGTGVSWHAPKLKQVTGKIVLKTGAALIAPLLQQFPHQEGGSQKQVIAPLLSTHPKKVLEKLFSAIEKQDIGEVRAAIKRGADVNGHLSEAKVSPLHVAVSKRSSELVVRLLHAGANILAPDQNMDTPLHWAYRHGYRLCIRALLDAGADVTVKNSSGLLPHEVDRLKKGDEKIALGPRHTYGRPRTSLGRS